MTRSEYHRNYYHRVRKLKPKTEKEIVAIREATRRYQSKPEIKAKRSKYQMEYARSGMALVRKKASLAVSRAIKSGELVKGLCRDCQSEVTEGHHPDYTKPLEVIWLCKLCHAREHVRINKGS